jgi:PEP-CTERM motif
MNISQTRSFALSALVFGAVSLCRAAPITYNVDQTIGAGSVTGTVETDGTIGILNANNFVDFNLLLNDGTNTFDGTSGTGGTFIPKFIPNASEVAFGGQTVILILGSDLSATATQLLFNFSGSDVGLALFEFALGEGTDFWCVDTSFVAGSCSSGGLGDTPSGETFDVGIATPAGVIVQQAPGQFTAVSGTQVIATVTPATVPNSTPEPSTLALLGGGLALIVFRKSKRSY